MAKLDKKTRDRVAKAESSGFEPIPDGAYHLRLRDVDTSRTGEKGPYWSWEFEVVYSEGGEHDKRRLWNNTSLSEKADFKMKETYEAFGVPLDTDTDEMLGLIVKGIVSQRTIQAGARKGELSNQIDRLKPADDEILAKVKEEAGKEKAVEDIF